MEPITLLIAAGGAALLSALVVWILTSTRQRVALREMELQQVALEHQLAAEQKATLERQGLFEDAEKSLRDAFQSLASEALNRNNQSFLELAQTKLGQFQQTASQELAQRQKAIDSLVAPIMESLGKVDSQLHQVEKERRGSHESIKKHLELVASSQRDLQNETANLVTALRKPGVRGRWGEIQLKRVVELAGMLEHCDFQEQVTVTTDDGRIRPDVVVRLPGDKYVVVDAKAPLEAFLDAHQSDDDEVRQSKLRDHSRQVRDHVNQLASKGYWEHLQPAPEFVVMFLPGESFFSAALEHEPTLLEYAAERNVIITSPTNLIALLRAVAYGWRQERIAESAEAISELGRELYERIGKLAGHFAILGRRLDGAVGAYNDAMGSLESRVLVSARRFRELGATGTGELESPEPVERRSRELRADEIAESR